MLKQSSYFHKILTWSWLFIALCSFTPLVYASGGSDTNKYFLWIAVLLLLAKLSSLIEKLKQPAVLGELIIGVLLGNLVLIGFNWAEPIKHDEMIKFLAELGVVILLFQIGLESKIEEMMRVGWRAFWVACVGVIVPFILGTYIVGPLVLPGLSDHAYLFLGATLTATSVGITGRVFKDLNKLQTPEAQIVLGAAVIDDVIGLIILAVVTAIVQTGSVDVYNVGVISTKALFFLVGAIFVGRFLAKHISYMLSHIHTGIGMKFTIIISFCLIFAYFAHLVGLAPIVGAFAAGLVLESVHFTNFTEPQINDEIYVVMEKSSDNSTKEKIQSILQSHSNRQLEELVAPLGYFLVPIFFIMTGIQVDLTTLLNPTVLGVALAITAVAFIGKLVSGLVAGNVNKWIVGWGMAPRGEVGLIFAMMGRQLGVVSNEVFSIIIIMVILTTLLTPPILGYLLRRSA